jgi:DNA-binding LytR/AlgR family response regulator
MTVDVAVVNFAMPSMNGAVLAQAARRLQPGLPIVFASGYANTAAFEAVSGATILRKPIQIAELADAVRRTLRNHAA